MADLVVRKRLLLRDEQGARRRVAAAIVIERATEADFPAAARELIARLTEAVGGAQVASCGSGIILGAGARCDAAGWNEAASASLRAAFAGATPTAVSCYGGLGTRLAVPAGDIDRVEIGVVDAPAADEAVLTLVAVWDAAEAQ
jgi:hypothetical protein